MDTKKSREEVNQSTSPMDHGGQPRLNDTGWPEGPDGKRDAPRVVADETKNPGDSTNDEMAEKQLSGEYDLKHPELDEKKEPKKAEEDDDADEETKGKKKKK
jgi:hypothetical protein